MVIRIILDLALSSIEIAFFHQKSFPEQLMIVQRFITLSDLS
jgi:hypothetical protein